MPKLRELDTKKILGLPGRELSQREKRELARYRSYVRNMLHDTNGENAVLELSTAEIRRVQTIKRWLRRAAREEGVGINVKKRGEFLILEAAE